MKNIEPITAIQNWYASKCDGEWEHSYGFSLESLDNPGWRIHIEGEQNKTEINIATDQGNDWIFIRSSACTFDCACSNSKLQEGLHYAVSWLG